MGFQPQPHKQFPTQLKQMQRAARQLQQITSKPFHVMTWTDLTPQLLNGFTAVSGKTPRFEIEPGGNFCSLSGVIVTPASPTNPMVFATLGNATECYPIRQEAYPAMAITSGNVVIQLGILVDTSGNLTIYGALTSGVSVYINGRYPLNVPA